MHIRATLLLWLTTTFLVGASAHAATAEPVTPKILSLTQVQALVARHNLGLLAHQAQVHMSQAEQRQAGLWPNPKLGIEIEGVGGSGPWSELDSAETTVTLEQPLETGGKRKKRQRLSDTRSRQAQHRYADQLRRTQAHTAQAFYKVLAAQEAVSLAQQNLDTAEALAHTVRQRVAAGKDSPIKEMQAAITVSEQRMALREARLSLITARQNLATLWGSTVPTFDSVQGPFNMIAPPPTVEEVLACIDSHPTSHQWQATVAEAEAELALAKAEPMPDVTLIGGYKRLEDVGQNTAVLGLALPLPVFNRNQGAKERATLALGRARHLQQQADVTLISVLKNRYQNLVAAAAQAQELQTEILPRVEQAHRAAVTAYKEGKFDYLEILAVQASLFETKQRTLAALSRYHNAHAELEAFTGTLTNLPTQEAKNDQ